MRSAQRTLLPALWVLLSAVVVGVDHATGPLLQFRVLQMIPVALASWYSSRGWGVGLALIMPAAGAWLSTLWEQPWAATPLVANALVRMAVLGVFAVLVDRASERERLFREVKVLRGLLPICSFCKKIRAENGGWHSLEAYIADRSEADFTHGVCPECAKEHYDNHFRAR